MKEYHIDKIFKSRWGKKILDWYSINKRDLPWRKKENKNFYRIWISEIMLQQTQVSVVIPYYNRFILKWPTLEDFYDAKFQRMVVKKELRSLCGIKAEPAISLKGSSIRYDVYLNKEK